MTRAEADGRQSRVDVGPVIVVVCDVQMARVFVRVAIGMPDEGALVPLSAPSCQPWKRSSL